MLEAVTGLVKTQSGVNLISLPLWVFSGQESGRILSVIMSFIGVFNSSLQNKQMNKKNPQNNSVLSLIILNVSHYTDNHLSELFQLHRIHWSNNSN